jgi:hypothetical protein
VSPSHSVIGFSKAAFDVYLFLLEVFCTLQISLFPQSFAFSVGDTGLRQNLVEVAETLAFFRLPLFSSEIFLMSPSVFLGLPLFSSKVFLMSPSVFLVLPLFSSDVFFVCAKVLVKCQANLVSYFDLALT